MTDQLEKEFAGNLLFRHPDFHQRQRCRQGVLGNFHRPAQAGDFFFILFGPQRCQNYRAVDKFRPVAGQTKIVILEEPQLPGLHPHLPTGKPKSGKGLAEKAVDDAGRVRVSVDPRYFRPAEVDTLLGDPSKAKRKLGWSARVSFEQLVEEMASEDLKAAERDELVKRHGHKPYDYHE